VPDPTSLSDHLGLVLSLFDRQAAAWPSKYAPGGRLTYRLARVGGTVLRQVPEQGRVLDLGCGTGELARWLAATGLAVVGCDISCEMLRGAAAGSATEDSGTPARWLRLDPDWRRLPFADGCFDAVTASSVLEYAADPAAVLGECARVLAPGGVLVCTVRWCEWLSRPAARYVNWPAGWAKWQDYRRYLRTSRQRHLCRWWELTASRAGLTSGLAVPVDSLLTPLRLLCFEREAGPPG